MLTCSRELEEVNQQLICETTRQFHKLEADVQRVEGILQEKELALEEMRQKQEETQRELEKAEEEKKQLIEAILEKDGVIHEYEHRVRQLMVLKAPQDHSEEEKGIES